MPTVSVRYIVDDVDSAIAFYCGQLDFVEQMHPAPTFAMLTRGALRLVLSAPGGGPGGGQPTPDGVAPEPGGWNRFAIEVDDLAQTVQNLRAAGARFRNDVVTGVGGKQILVEDPSGNPVELFEPTRAEARLDAHVEGAPEAALLADAGNDLSGPGGAEGRPACKHSRGACSLRRVIGHYRVWGSWNRGAGRTTTSPMSRFGGAQKTVMAPRSE